MSYETKTLHHAPLRTLVSARVRLNENERQQLKRNYRELKDAQLPASSPTLKGSTVTVSTAFSARTDVDQKIGLDRFLLADVLNSRDSINLGLVLQLQETLNVPLITKEQFLDSCENYWNHLTGNIKYNDNPGTAFDC